MEKRSFEKLGIKTSLLGYGCMRFPITEEGAIDIVEAERLLDKAYAEGITYFDTAYPYHHGESERVVGAALKKYDRSSFYLATKLPAWKVEKIEDVDAIVAEQLEKLQMDYIDFYLLHAMSRERWDKMVALGVVERLLEMKKVGKIRYLGFSFHDTYEVFEEIINYYHWDFCQIQLNYMDTEIQAGLKGYELTVQKNIPLVIMEPVKGGRLASFAADITERFRQLDPDASAASFALRWVATLPNVRVVLSGMTTMDQLEDNLKTFRDFKPMNEKELQVVKEIADLIHSRVQNGCTGCGYCMPCPAGVDIPANFRVWNTYHMYRQYDIVSKEWESRLGDEKQAKNCLKCGKCEKVCPQKLHIRKDLERVQQDMDEQEW